MDDDETELRESIERRIGTTLKGKYLLEGLLGVGGMAAVYRATNVAVRRPCAVKMLHRDLSRLSDVRGRFLREGRVANTVGHPGAVDVLDSDFAEDGSAFMVMELLLGDSVESFADAMNTRPGIRFVLCVAHELLGVLAMAHAKGIVHRDIKPANLFVTKDGDLKVLDFGVARILEAGSGYNVTRSGTVMGTPAFMAPEQAMGSATEVGPRADLWSVGATMFKLFSGRNVHEAQTAQEMMILVATKRAVSLGSVAPAIPPEVVALVDRALAFTKEERWPDAATMRAAVAAEYLAAFGEAISTKPLAAIYDAPARAPAVGPAPAPPSPTLDATVRDVTVRVDGAPPIPGLVKPHAVAAASAGPLPNTTGARIPLARLARWQLAMIAIVMVALGVGATTALMGARRQTRAESELEASTAVASPSQLTTTATTSTVPQGPASAASSPILPASVASATPAPPTSSSAPAGATSRGQRRTTGAVKPPGSTSAPLKPPAPRDPLAP